MQDLIMLIKDLISYPNEEEWFEFKENWYQPDGIGEYVSAISNAAAMKGRSVGYFVWGVHDKTHELTGTAFDFHADVKNEPLEHYLARQLTPDINFRFEEVFINGRRIIILIIPAAHTIPTAYKGIRYLRIGSSKVNLIKYPEREAALFRVLNDGLPTIENIESKGIYDVCCPGIREYVSVDVSG